MRSRCMHGALQDVDFIRPDTAAFEDCPSDSIDYAVMERLPSDAAAGVPAALVPLAAGWSDLGAWDAVWSVQPKDAAGNAAVGPAVSMDSRNTLLFPAAGWWPGWVWTTGRGGNASTPCWPGRTASRR